MSLNGNKSFGVNDTKNNNMKAYLDSTSTSKRAYIIVFYNSYDLQLKHNRCVRASTIVLLEIFMFVFKHEITLTTLLYNSRI